MPDAVEEGKPSKERIRFAETEEMFPGLTWLIHHVVHERLFERFLGPVLEDTGKRKKDRKIRRAFQVEHPPGLFRLIVLLKADFLERL